MGVSNQTFVWLVTSKNRGIVLLNREAPRMGNMDCDYRCGNYKSLLIGRFFLSPFFCDFSM